MCGGELNHRRMLSVFSVFIERLSNEENDKLKYVYVKCVFHNI